MVRSATLPARSASGVPRFPVLLLQPTDRHALASPRRVLGVVRNLALTIIGTDLPSGIAPMSRMRRATGRSASPLAPQALPRVLPFGFGTLLPALADPDQ
jgi:hypothetical protein